MAIELLTDNGIRKCIREHDQRVAVAQIKAREEGRQTPLTITSLKDGQGLRLDLRGTGVPRWILRYTSPATGRPTEMKIGTYPDTPLALARKRASTERSIIQGGNDPHIVKADALKAAREAEQKQSRTFGVIIQEYLDQKKWGDELNGERGKTRQGNEGRVRNHMQMIVSLTIDEITPKIILDQVLRPIVMNETRTRVHSLINQAYKYAIIVGDTMVNPARDLGLLLEGRNKKRFAAPQSPAEIKVVWEAIDAVPSLPTRIALKLQFLTAQRPYNIRTMEWSEVDLDAALWRIPIVKMKVSRAVKEEDPENKNPHVVPLSRQAVEIFKLLPPNNSRYCFPSPRTKTRPLCDAALLAALRAVGISPEQTTCHGARAAFSTTANESGLFSSDSVERHLAHVLPGGDVRNAYNRGQFLEERRKLSQWYSDFLDSL